MIETIIVGIIIFYIAKYVINFMSETFSSIKKWILEQTTYWLNWLNEQTTYWLNWIEMHKEITISVIVVILMYYIFSTKKKKFIRHAHSLDTFQFIQQYKRKALKYLITQNISIDDLFLKSIDKNNTELLNIFINEGANIETTNNNGCTPLLVAVKNNYIELVNLLLEKGANIEATNNYGYTPLAVAVENNNSELVDLLIEKGADFNA